MAQKLCKVRITASCNPQKVQSLMSVKQRLWDLEVSIDRLKELADGVRQLAQDGDGVSVSRRLYLPLISGFAMTCDEIYGKGKPISNLIKLTYHVRSTVKMVRVQFPSSVRRPELDDPNLTGTSDDLNYFL